MPRVHTRVKAARGKEYTCSTCGKTIDAGQPFYYWTRRFGRSGHTYRQHQTCGYPRPTQLSSRKTAQVIEAASAAEADITAWTPELPEEPTLELVLELGDIEAALGTVADEAESVAEEYESSVGNMPEGFQNGPTAEAMNDVAQRLNDWAQDLRSWSENADFSLPDPEEYDSPESWRNDAQQILDDVLDTLRTSATDLLSEVPEYEG